MIEFAKVTLYAEESEIPGKLLSIVYEPSMKRPFNGPEGSPFHNYSIECNKAVSKVIHTLSQSDQEYIVGKLLASIRERPLGYFKEGKWIEI